MNNIVKRGFGVKHRIVTRGYGSFIEQILDAAERAAKKVGSAAKEVADDLKEKFIIVRAALVEVNEQRIENIKGADKGSLKTDDVKVSAKVLISSVYKSLKEIFIRATNVRSSRRRRE